MKKVKSINATWIFALMLIIPGSVLHAEDPTSTAPVPPALRRALSSSLDEAVSIGVKSIPAPPTGSWGIVSEGDGAGGIFRDSNSDAEAWLGAEEVGVHGFGALAGGHFEDSVDSGEAWVGHGNYGIEARGSEMGGYFEDSDGSGFAHLGWGDTGVFGRGNVAGGVFDDRDGSGYARAGYGDRGVDAGGTEMGGYFLDSDGTGNARVGYGDRGIEAYGTGTGGYFEDSDGTGFAHLGWGDTGVFGRGNVAGGVFEDRDGSGYIRAGYGDRGVEAGGTEMGGYFEDSDGTGYAWVGTGDYGIKAHGNLMGGYFEDLDEFAAATVAVAGWGIDAQGHEGGGDFSDTDSTSRASVAQGDWGIRAFGNEAGGYFENIDGSGIAHVGTEGYGIKSYGDWAGGYFEDSNGSAQAWVGRNDKGIEAWGSFMGGRFMDLGDATYSNVAFGTYSIQGSGTKAFVQNHPYDRDSLIVYAAPEGDEVATYTRGTAKIFGGEATVPLGETFKWVTNPGIGLTAHLTPRGEPIPLAVVDLSTEEMIVRASADAADGLVFDYIVYGLRIGFEESSIVQEKIEEAYIPSMADHRELYVRRPDLKSFNSLERFKRMHHDIDPKAKLDLSRAQALRDAIVEFDPAVHELPRPPGHEERPADDLALEDSHRESVHRVRAARVDHDRRPATDQSNLSAATPVDEEGNGYAPSFRPPSREVATLVDVSESVEPGDVIVLDRDTAGVMRRGFEGHDSGVIGVVLGSRSPAQSDEEIEAETALHAEVAMAGVVKCKVDATFGAIWPGNLLVTSPTSGHAMRTDAPLPGTIVGKALEPLEEGTGTIRVLVMLR